MYLQVLHSKCKTGLCKYLRVFRIKQSIDCMKNNVRLPKNPPICSEFEMNGSFHTHFFV